MTDGMAVETIAEEATRPPGAGGQLTRQEKVPVTVIRPSRGWVSLNLRDLWEYRELLYFLTWRDIKVRYKQTVLGAAWAIIQPFFTMVVFSLFFGKLQIGQLRSGQEGFQRLHVGHRRLMILAVAWQQPVQDRLR
jgi:hypothetical protein